MTQDDIKTINNDKKPLIYDFGNVKVRPIIKDNNPLHKIYVVQYFNPSTRQVEIKTLDDPYNPTENINNLYDLLSKNVEGIISKGR